MKNTLVFVLLLCAASACRTSQKCVEKIRPECSCLAEYDPVCGCNNKTYGNACMAECASITTYVKGECPKENTSGLEGKVWQLATFAVGPEPKHVPAEIAIALKFENGSIEGHGSCNSIGGKYQLKGRSLTVTELFSTEMHCEHTIHWETMLLRQLEKSQSYAISDETLEINCGEMGTLVFHSNRSTLAGE